MAGTAAGAYPRGTGAGGGGLVRCGTGPPSTGQLSIRPVRLGETNERRRRINQVARPREAPLGRACHQTDSDEGQFR